MDCDRKKRPDGSYTQHSMDNGVLEVDDTLCNIAKNTQDFIRNIIVMKLQLNSLLIDSKTNYPLSIAEIGLSSTEVDILQNDITIIALDMEDDYLLNTLFLMKKKSTTINDLLILVSEIDRVESLGKSLNRPFNISKIKEDILKKVEEKLTNSVFEQKVYILIIKYIKLIHNYHDFTSGWICKVLLQLDSYVDNNDEYFIRYFIDAENTGWKNLGRIKEVLGYHQTQQLEDIIINGIHNYYNGDIDKSFQAISYWDFTTKSNVDLLNKIKESHSSNNTIIKEKILESLSIFEKIKFYIPCKKDEIIKNILNNHQDISSILEEYLDYQKPKNVHSKSEYPYDYATIKLDKWFSEYHLLSKEFSQ